MPDPEKVATVVRGWISKAENDLKTAQIILNSDGPTDTAVFHAQQCAEKYLKAYLTFAGTDFPKTHDIGELTARAANLSTGLTPKDCQILTKYAVTTRYPDEYEPISISEGRRALRLTRKVRAAVRKELATLMPTRRKS
jgi:HEPN domain-containing protein